MQRRGDQTDSVITSLNQITKVPGKDETATNRKTNANTSNENNANLESATDQINPNASGNDNSIAPSKRPKSNTS